MFDIWTNKNSTKEKLNCYSQKIKILILTLRDQLYETDLGIFVTEVNQAWVSWNKKNQLASEKDNQFRNKKYCLRLIVKASHTQSFSILKIWNFS